MQSAAKKLGPCHQLAVWMIVASGLGAHSSVWSQEFSVAYDMNEFQWSDSGTLEFATEFFPGPPRNAWGDALMSDTYVETGSSMGKTDIFIPASEQVVGDLALVIAFDTRYLTSDSAHSYLAFGNDSDTENAIWFGYGAGNSFYAGTGLGFDLAGSEPAGVQIEFSTTHDIEHGSRIGLRFGYDIASSEILNLQVDANNDGVYETELLADPIDLSASGLEPLDWFAISYFGKGGSRLDDVLVEHLSLFGDYDRDLSFDMQDADLLCTGVSVGDLAFDYNGDGTLDTADMHDFAWGHGSLVGDLDFNGEVAFSDFLVLSDSFGQAGSWSSGDLDCNGQVAFTDFLLMTPFFGTAAAPQAAHGVRSVPEPNLQGLWIVILICCVRARLGRQ